MFELFLFCAVIGGTFLACQIAMTLMGIGSDADVDVSGDVGARHLIGDNEDCLLEIAMDDDSILADLDTPAALAAHKASRKR